ncbi:MAG: glutamate--tRNA ligase family protein [Acidimicrobiales bacterium]
MSDVATPRVRFAPSPTGFLHVGSARTALFNWLFARSTGGTFVLRIEDTDAERNRPELTQVIFDELRWLGLDWDEGPFFQSERRDRHREVVESLLAADLAYVVDAEDRPVDGADGIVDGHAVRFRMPPGRTVSFDDVVRGSVSFSTDDLEDFVVWRSNGSPPFLLANAVDDADMGITHAIRGEDLLAGAPKVILLMEAIGAPAPTYAHLPLLVNEARKKLSKRRDDVAIADYRRAGYLPDAMANYLTLLGWGPPDDIEIRPMNEFVELFDLDDVNKAPAFFDIDKLTHINATRIRALPVDEFTAACRPWLTGDAPWPAERFDPGVWDALASIVQEKVRTLADVVRFVDWLFLAEPVHDEDSWQKAMVKGKAAAEMLDGALEMFGSIEWEAGAVHAATLEIGERNGLKLGKAQAPIRVAVTGRTVGPPLFESIVLLDRDEALRRIRVARGRL